MAVQPAPLEKFGNRPNGQVGGKAFYCFETITLAPIDLNLVDSRLLTRFEVEWLNDYHAKVRDIVAPQLDGADLEWLEAECAPL